LLTFFYRLLIHKELINHSFALAIFICVIFFTDNQWNKGHLRIFLMEKLDLKAYLSIPLRSRKSVKNKEMKHLSYKTKFATKETHQAEWFVIDASGQKVGRLASKVASVLRGKHKPTYTPHTDAGDYVIILNAQGVEFSGNKLVQKQYQTYSGYPGGQKSESAKSLMNRAPIKVVEHAVKGMLPKNRLGRKMYKKLFVYEGAEHPHGAQKPAELK